MGNFSIEQILIVTALTTFAGLATGIGGAIGFFVRRTNTRLLTFLLGLSAGVMIFISFVELFASAQRDLAETHGALWGKLIALGAFFGGIAVALLIDRLVPEDENPHEAHGVEELSDAAAHGVPAGTMRRSGMLFMLAIGIHNFPEGMATFAAGLSGLSLGVPIAIAIALHNIPEGLTVSVPIFYATGSRKKAFLYSRCLRCFSRRSRESWFSFRLTNCSRCPSAGGITICRFTESAWACSSWAARSPCCNFEPLAVYTPTRERLALFQSLIIIRPQT